MRRALILVGLVVAYLALFLGGAALLGPGVDRASLTPAEQASSLPMAVVIAMVDTGLFALWISRARDRGLALWAEAFVVFYGTKTFSSQLEVAWFVDERFVPRAMLPSLFVMTLPLAVAWTGLAVLALGPREAEAAPADGRAPLPLPGPGASAATAARVALAGAVLYPVLFFLFGYGVAWQAPAVRAYYGGPEVALPLVAHFSATFREQPLVVPFEMARGLLWVAIGWPVLKRTAGPWWVGGLLFAAMVALVQNDVHLLPNPLMPREVRLWHLVETASSNFLFGLGTAALLAPAGALARLRVAPA